MSADQSQAVVSQNQGNVAIVLMQSPPVNALSKAVRVGLIETISAALNDDSIEAIVVSSEQALFSGGADISEFSSGDFEPPLPAVLELIENADKPIIAVLNGPAFGGGVT